MIETQTEGACAMVLKLFMVAALVQTGIASNSLSAPEVTQYFAERPAIVAPISIDSLIDRAEAYAQCGDLSASMGFIKQALALDPQNIRAHFARAFIDYNSGNLEATLADYNQILLLAPDNANAHLHRGCLFYELGHGDLARKDFDRAVALTPKADDKESLRAVVLLQTLQQLPICNDYRGAFRALSESKQKPITE